MKATPKQPPKRDVIGMGPAGKQGVKLDQGKYVLSSVNAPAKYPELINEKRRLDGVNFDPGN